LISTVVEVAHVTRDSDTTFKVKRSKARSPGRFGWLYWQANMDIVVTYPYAYMTYIVSTCEYLYFLCTCMPGRGIIVGPPAYRLFEMKLCNAQNRIFAG